MRIGRLYRLCGAALLAAGAGCAGPRGDLDLLEVHLREQQDLLARYERLFQQQERDLAAARRETDLLRAQLADQNVPPLLPEHADVLLRAEQLAFHTLLTGTRDLDPQPGDDRLNVVLMPQAHTGEVVPLVGSLEIEALDLSRPEGQQQLARWTFTAEEARDHWHAGFLASGFQFELPWENRTAGEVLLHARLNAPDGRQLDATHSLRIHSPLAQGKRRTPATRPSPAIVPASNSTPRAAAPPPPQVEAPLAPPAMPPLLPPHHSSAQSLPAAAPFPAAAPTAPLTPSPVGSVPAASVDPPRLSTGRDIAVPPPAELPIVVPLAPAQTPAQETTVPATARPDGGAGAAARSPNAVTIVPLDEPPRPRRASGPSEREPPPLSQEPLFPQGEAPPASGGESPPPFPEVPAVRTSDRWTDESIPYLR